MTEKRNPFAMSKHVKGEERREVRQKIARMYTGDDTTPAMSIREIAEETGRSYGFVHRLLFEAADMGLTGGFRSRGFGGRVPKPRAEAA